MGGSDRLNEGDWTWESSGETISLSREEWGSGVAGNEPDNFENQDSLAIALESWPLSDPGALGSAGQWNDVDETNKLFFVVEYDPVV